MLSPTDEYALACVLQGKSYEGVAPSPLLRDMMANVSRNGVEGVKALQKALSYLLDQETLTAILRVDTDVPPALPPTPINRDAAYDVPDLPAGVRLTPAQERQAEEVGAFEREYTAWASAVANQTPIAYHRACAITLAAVAIGRRCYVSAPWGQYVFPNQYVVLLGTTTYHRKSTGLNLLRRLAEDAFSHLLMPRPGSAENFGNMLAGKWDTDGLPPEDKEELDRARPFAGQRVIIRDEISGLFRSFGRDHMAGLKEDLMDMYEGPRTHKLSTNSKGIVIARNIAPSVIGASTPAGMSAAVSGDDWRDGNLARFLLITPEEDYGDRPAPKGDLPPDRLITVLSDLHKRLPMPPGPNALGGQKKTEEWSLVAPIWDAVNGYADALRQMTNPKRAESLDDRLRGTYGRHHVKALKVAICLATMDWHTTGSKDSHPTVTMTHWWRAQQIAEDWRASSHRFLREMTISEDAESENRVITYIRRNPDGVTSSDLIHSTRLKANAIKATLESLMESGQIEMFKRKGNRGPEATCYKAV